MPNNTRAMNTFVFLIAIGLAVSTAEDLTGGISSGREPASVSKKISLESQKSKVPQLKRTAKVRGPIEVKIEMPSALPEKSGDVFVVKGLITSSESLRDVSFKWGLPDNVEVVNGESSGTLDTLTANEWRSVQLTLKTLTGENHRLNFIASSTGSGARFADSANYNTLLQGLLEDGRKQLLKSVEEHEQKNPGFKVFH